MLERERAPSQKPCSARPWAQAPQHILEGAHLQMHQLHPRCARRSVLPRER